MLVRGMANFGRCAADQPIHVELNVGGLPGSQYHRKTRDIRSHKLRKNSSHVQKQKCIVIWFSKNLKGKE